MVVVLLLLLQIMKLPIESLLLLLPLLLVPLLLVPLLLAQALLLTLPLLLLALLNLALRERGRLWSIHRLLFRTRAVQGPHLLSKFEEKWSDPQTCPAKATNHFQNYHHYYCVCHPTMCSMSFNFDHPQQFPERSFQKKTKGSQNK